MLHSVMAERGLVVAPHHLAAQAGLDVLREGGNAIEAMVAAAATISVVYPHMNGLGGDGFWLIDEPGRDAPRAIVAVGAAAAAADQALYQGHGLETVPTRGPLAANTVAGTVAGWKAALEISSAWGSRLPLERLFADAIHHAEHGFPVTESQHRNTREKRGELADVPGWAGHFLEQGRAPEVGQRFAQPALGATLRRLAAAGLDDFYRGETARAMAAELERVGSPLRAADLAAQQAVVTEPLSVELGCGTVYNAPPPSQGLASLIILGVFDRLNCTEAEGFDHIHGLVEATKEAFTLRDREITDPAYMAADPSEFLQDAALDAMARRIDRAEARAWPADDGPGDTVWLGAVDGSGRVVSFIHSIYWEFGSGLCLSETGVQWQNRGSSFSLDPARQNFLRPGRLPFHTNNPALARLRDGRVMAYGAMGGDGQPQSQAAVFSRYAMFGRTLQEAITLPRWVLGRTWGARRTNLRLEARFPDALLDALRGAGHDVETVDAFDEVMGHAGAAVRQPSGLLEGASDPRCDGAAAAF